MQKPRSFGIIVLIYALAAHLFGAIGATGLLTMSHKPFENAGDYLFVVLSVLPMLLLPLYLAGGAGLLFLRRWALFAVLLAAGVDILSYIVSVVSIIMSSQKTMFAGVDTISLISMLAPLTRVVVPGIIVFFTLRLRADADAWTRSPFVAPASREMPVEQRKDAVDSRYLYLFRGMIATGLVLPWLVGVGVKLYLSAHGKPTIPWSYFINIGSILLLIPFAIWFSLSYIMLAYVGRTVLAKPFFGLETITGRLIFVLGGFAGGVIGTVMTFIEVFWVFDFLYFLAPLWAFNIPHMLAGALAGYVLGKGYEKFFRK
ncbi:MAG: hypothetical protein HGB15_02435 [Chlorobaculum sp.]|nr:hypothetical protein [Chlorobaculum sp.]